jgi:hypothetical protein
MDERPDAVLHASQTVSRYDLNIASIQGDPNNETSKDGMLMVKINNGMLKDGTARLCIAPVPSLNCGALREKKRLSICLLLEYYSSAFLGSSQAVVFYITATRNLENWKQDCQIFKVAYISVGFFIPPDA